MEISTNILNSDFKSHIPIIMPILYIIDYLYFNIYLYVNIYNTKSFIDILSKFIIKDCLQLKNTQSVFYLVERRAVRFTNVKRGTLCSLIIQRLINHGFEFILYFRMTKWTLLHK